MLDLCFDEVTHFGHEHDFEHDSTILEIFCLSGEITRMLYLKNKYTNFIKFHFLLDIDMNYISLNKFLYYSVFFTIPRMAMSRYLWN